ncbi:MAG: hypothetical protein AVDCRST_MAG13-1633 [uncultured Solirubrobacteraceae bacterium]|uniref:SnoaL-like domain-containing protein n=1 Tax=uncultured Solirubrobacteraceae bacterium TaxID=1162706 RepID=A0A6J4SA98_9ACTN|nr:MAG: hypothetical protein AVDCRST_MAG13-1633 [uncultured Solirubrobacteraceae bacterium]
MNAVERLWRALGRRDWDSAERQLHPSARISWPHTGEIFPDAEAYVTAFRLIPGTPRITVERFVADERHVGVLVSLQREDGERRCGGFYLLQEGRIASGTELWVVSGGREVPPYRR